MKFLIIQTAFLGDVILATPLIEKLRHHFPESTIDFVVRKGNEPLFEGHPHLRKVWVLDKKKNKYRNLFRMIREIRTGSYDYVINVQRFFTTGLMTFLSGGKTRIGFDKNPWSFCYDHKIKHEINVDSQLHEVDRNLLLIEWLTDQKRFNPKLYPTEKDSQKFRGQSPYVCMAPASVWFTKQVPAEKWVELISQLPPEFTVYLLGSPQEASLCQQIVAAAGSSRVESLAGKLNLLESAALMRNAVMNYTNDSAPTHLASAVNAPVTVFYCSTLPGFGFGPLSDQSSVVEVEEELSCRPCGLHGHRTCPQGHFKCSQHNMEQAARRLKSIP